MDDLTFDPVEHRYYVGGIEYPSVTTILKAAGIYSEYTDVDPAILANAGVRGDAVHQAIEIFLTTGEWSPHIGDDAAPYIKAFNSWYRWSELEVWEVEHRTFSNMIGVAGTIDIVGELDGVPSIIDIKTTRLLNKVAAGYQTAGYRLMWNEHEGSADQDLWVTNRYALQLRYDGTPRLEPLKEPLDELKFIGMAMKHGRAL